MLRDRLGELRHQLDRIARKGGTLLVTGDELPALKQEYLRLNREQVSLTAVSELLRRAYEQARVEEANPVPAFSMLDSANFPGRHSRPKRGLTVIMAMMLSAAVSLGYLYWREGRGPALVAAGPAHGARELVPVGAQVLSTRDLDVASEGDVTAEPKGDDAGRRAA